VGPGMNLDAAFAVSAFIRRAMVGLPLEVSTTPITRSFCHINDMIVQCLHVMAHGLGEPYEVGSDDPFLIGEAALLISDDVVLVGRSFQTNAGQSRYIANLTKLRDRFNISLDFDSKTSILDTYHWHVANQTSI
ncbi:hypothetical protein OEZ82_25750, partial [Leclercia adecarboxylata]|uniref:hypothetical protein n=1 Tax=Leclercia adecarboxylata TaxID=83655 RepID=UPI00234D6A8D